MTKNTAGHRPKTATRQATSVIERMIDEACGFPKDWKPKERVMLHCPKCGKYGSTDRMDDDPPDLKLLDVECPDCV